jgi:hypothetical protein
MDDLSFARPRFFRAIKEEENLTIRMPEGLFDDLLEKKTYDLLALEEILAQSVDAIVIFPESPGSFAELGAFSGNESLRQKTICVCEEAYKTALSFINVGPIKILKSVKPSRVIYTKYKFLDNKDFAYGLANKIVTRVRALKKEKRENIYEEKGLFLLEDLIIYALFSVQTATQEQINQFYTSSQIGVAENKLRQIYDICLNTLLTSNRIEKNADGSYQLTERVVHEILNRTNKDRLSMLYAVRVEAMNASLRRHAETKSARMKALLP